MKFKIIKELTTSGAGFPQATDVNNVQAIDKMIYSQSFKRKKKNKKKKSQKKEI